MNQCSKPLTFTKIIYIILFPCVPSSLLYVFVCLFHLSYIVIPNTDKYNVHKNMIIFVNHSILFIQLDYLATSINLDVDR